MINNIYYIYRQFPKSVWSLTLLQILFVARTTFFATKREVGDYSVMMNSSTFFIIALISISALIILNEFKYFKNANRTIHRLIIYYILCLCSCLWSGMNTVILFKSIEVLCNIYIMYIIASKIANIKLLLLYIIVLSTITSYIEVLNGIINYGIIFMHTNSYTMCAMIGLILGIQAIRFNILKYRTIKLFLILNLIAIIFGTSSATYISFIIGLIFIYSSNKNGINFGKALLLIGICSIVYYLFIDIINKYLFFGKEEENIITASGRSSIFEVSINAWKANPLLGNGYIIGERNLGKYGLGTNVLSSHNTFLSVLVNTGIVGMILFLNFLLSWGRNLIKKSKSNIYTTIIAPAFIASIINCLSFPAIGSEWNYVGSIIFLMYIMTYLFIRRSYNI